MSNRFSGAAAAALMALLTLGTFGSVRNTGPEAVVRRFHEAAIRGDVSTLETISIHAEGDNSVGALQQRVVFLNRNNFRVGVRSVDRSRPDIVVAEFVYQSPNGTQMAVIYWVAQRTRSGWKVQTDETLGVRV